ncbi:hypothetical protein [Streptomyces sp. NPDC008240]|uniref:hypothetical protein n=1 Tax=Streptomyces sp. NPDC008240 TaxID=3364822 RepID=UPI0036E4982D
MTRAGPSVPETAVVFERLLDQALNSPQVLDALDRAEGVADREQLRTRAVRARTAITAAVTVEYQEYLRARSAAEGVSDEAAARRAGGPLSPSAVLVTALSAVKAAWRWVAAARRDRAAGAGDTPAGDVPDVKRARETWELALLERAVVPFLLGRLEELLMRERGDRAARQKPAPDAPVP